MLEQERSPGYIFDGQSSIFVPRLKTEKSQTEAHENFKNLEEDEFFEEFENLDRDQIE